MLNNFNYSNMQNNAYSQRQNLSNKKRLSNFDRRIVEIQERGLDLIDNLQNLLTDLNLSNELHPTRFKIKEYQVLKLLSGSSYADLRRLGAMSSNTVYHDLENLNELFRITDSYVSRYGLDIPSSKQGITYIDDRSIIFEHLNDSPSYSTFVRRLNVLGNYIDKELSSKGDFGTIEDGFGYKNNIRLIRYDFVRYH